MKIFGSWSELVSIIFRKDSQAVTLRPNQSTTYTAARDVQLPVGDAAHELVGTAASQTLTNKTIDASSNTISNIDLAADVTGTLPLTNGGTGQTTANAALNALLPSQAGNAGRVLGTDGTDTSWEVAPAPALTDGDIFVGNSSNVATARTVSGDITLSNTGVASISSGVIVNADISTGAAIAGTKISPDFGSQNLTTTGTVGIGVSAGSSTQVSIDSSSAIEPLAIYRKTSTTSSTIFRAFSDVGTTANELLRLTADGHLRATRSANGNVFSGIRDSGAEIQLYCDTTAGWLGTGSNHSLSFYTNSSAAQMTLSTAGNLGINSTNITNKLTIGTNGGSTTGTIFVSQGTAEHTFQSSVSTGSMDYMIFYRSNSWAAGDIVGRLRGDQGARTLAFVNGSDERLKTEIKDFQATPVLKAIDVVEYEWTDNPGEKYYGVKAQQAYQHWPKAIAVGSQEGPEDEENFVPWGVSYTEFIPLLMKSVKEQQDIIEDLKSRIEALEV